MTYIEPEKQFKECPVCQGAGWKGDPKNNCSACGGWGYYEEVRGVKISWRKKMQGFPPASRNLMETLFSLTELLVFGVGALSFLVGAVNLGDSLRAHEGMHLDSNLFFDVFFAGYTTAPLWLGVFLFTFLYYNRYYYRRPRLIRASDPYYGRILLRDGDEAPGNQSGGGELDISVSASPELIQIIRRALDLAFVKRGYAWDYYVLYALLGNKHIFEVFSRLEIRPTEFLEDIAQKTEELEPVKEAWLDGRLKHKLIEAFWEAVKAEEETIEPEHLLFAVVSREEFKPVLNKYGVDKEDFHNMIVWTGFEKEKGARYLLNEAWAKPPHHYMNRSWTAVPTTTLDRFSVDVTDYARANMLFPLVGRQEEMRMLLRVLTRTTKNNVLLIGEEGSGREALIRGLARRIVRNKVDGKLFDKRVVKLNVGKIGSNSEMLRKNLEEVMGEAIHAGNVILFIPSIHELAKAGTLGSMDVISFLAPLFQKSVIQIIGSTTPEDYRRYIEPRGDFAQTFDSIKTTELSKEDSLKVLSMQIPVMETRERVSVTYRAAEEAVDEGKAIMPDRLLPQKAIDIVAEAIVRAKNVKGKKIVTEDEVREVISEKTGVPVTKIKGKEVDNLLNMEEELRKSVVGQEEAVKKVAAAIRRLRVRIGEKERPTAVFMFLGPTGVGKTEMAKTLAKIYFGSRDKMVRLDMSEFVSPMDLDRLIGSSEGTVPGLLTEPVRKNPFTLVLLDEFEKAHPKVWDLFLQIFDDGRITNGQGKVVDFSNAILIATSNAGSKIILENIHEGRSNEELKKVVQEQLLGFFRPEFLNRFDDLIIFNALKEEDVKQIIQLEIKQLNERLDDEQGLQVELTPGALSYLAKKGYSREFGARFLKRLMREKIEDALVVGILKGTYPRGTTVQITEEHLQKES